MQVKVCSFKSKNFEKDVLTSFKETGFAVIVDHEIDSFLIREAQDDWRTFFKLDTRTKSRFTEEDPNLGYRGFKSERAVGAPIADLKEYYHFKPGMNVPAATDAIASHTLDIYSQLSELGMVVLNVIDEDNNNDTNYAESCLESDNTILRTLYYPPLSRTNAESGAVRAAAHEDINFITMLVAASAPGLEVMDKSGNWHAVPHQENAIICNVGDMLQLASGGKYQSTTHRVVNPDNSTSDRISMPLFIHPFSTTELVPGKTAQQYLNERLEAIHGFKK